MFYKLGSFIYKTRWAVLGIWLAIIVAAGIFAPRAPEILRSGGFELPSAESVRASDEIASRFNGSRSYIFAVFTAPTGMRADDPAYAQSVDKAVAGVRDYKDAQQVVTFASSGAKDFVSADGRYSYALLGFNLTIDDTQSKLKEILPKIDKGNLDMKLTGLPIVYEAFNVVSQHDVEQAELYTFPLALIILLLVFRTVVAAAMPLMMALVSVLTTLGMIYFIGQATSISIFVLNIATMLGLGMGIDYSLFVVSRFREEMYKQNNDVAGSIATTIATSGKAVFFSGLTVMVGLGSLLLFQFTMLRSIGIGGLLVVGMNVLAALTLLPAVMAVLGKRINAWKIPGLRSVEEQMARQSVATGFWHGLAEKVARRPIAVAVVVLAILLFMGSPFLHARFGEPTHQALPATEPSRQAAEILEQNFPGYTRSSDMFLLVKARNGLMTDPANSAALYNYAEQLKTRFPQIRQVQAGGQDVLAQRPEQVQQLLGAYGSTPEALPAPLKAYVGSFINREAASLRLITNVEYSSKSASDFVRDLRAFQPGELSVAVTGEQPGLMDFIDVLYADFPVAIALVVVITYFVLFLMFQSVLLPLKAVIMTGLSLTASYGALVWIFQDGNLSGVLNTPPLGYVEATLPILLFAILFGLSMDYEVFMLSRVKEHYDETGNNSKSVAMGLERTGSMITSAALVMVVVAGAFGTADIVVIKAVGIGMALAVALDATIVRALLVPATMELLGNANWWAPRFVRRMLPKLSVE